MKTPSIKLVPNECHSSTTSSNLLAKLEKLKIQKVITIFGPLLKNVPSFSPDAITLQVDSFHLKDCDNTIILGDGDSVESEKKAFFDYLFPVQKNFTDFEALIQLLKDYSEPKHLHFYGFWGGRFDHHLLIPCQISEFFLTKNGIRSAWIYDEDNNPRIEILAAGEHNFDEQNSFSFISPNNQKIHLQGKVAYSGKFMLPAYSGLGLSNSSNGEWSMLCQLPIWKYILSNK